MTAAARRLLAQALLAVRGITAELDVTGDIEAWRDAFAGLIARYHTAAQLVGQGGGVLSVAGRQALVKAVQAQLGYLDGFAANLRAPSADAMGRQARAAMYAEAIGASYWRGATRMLPLPALPKDGTTQCLTNCGCSWEIDQLEGDGNFDCTWVLGTSENCQTCSQRAADWAPLRIREGRLV